MQQERAAYDERERQRELRRAAAAARREEEHFYDGTWEDFSETFDAQFIDEDDDAEDGDEDEDDIGVPLPTSWPSWEDLRRADHAEESRSRSRSRSDSWRRPTWVNTCAATTVLLLCVVLGAMMPKLTRSTFHSFSNAAI